MIGIWKHYKGGIYHVIGTGKHTETEEDFVIYESADGRVWLRPKAMFLEEIEVDGMKVKRFEYIGKFNMK